MKRMSFRVPNAWRRVAAAVAAVVGFLALYLYRLGSLPDASSVSELQTQTGSSSLHNIAANPLQAPYKLAEFLMLHAHREQLAATRVPSVVVALLAVTIFYFMVRHWHGRRTGLLAGLLFATSGWLLHVGRLGSVGSLALLVPLGLLGAAFVINTTERHHLALIGLATACAVALFVPAGIWFVLCTILLLRHQIAEHAADANAGSKIVAALILLLSLGALAPGLVHHPNLIKVWLGLPTQLPSLTTMGKQWLDTILYLFVRGPGTSELWLPHLPILSIFESALCLIGVYFYATRRKNLRSQLLGAFALLGSLAVALNGPDVMSFIVPIAYLLAATGMAFLLHKWLGVFPFNPVARTGGVILLTLTVLVAVGYHTESYFIAWHYAPATHQTFRFHS